MPENGNDEGAPFRKLQLSRSWATPPTFPFFGVAWAIPGRFLEHPRKACNIGLAGAIQGNSWNILTNQRSPARPNHQQCQKMETTGAEPSRKLRLSCSWGGRPPRHFQFFGVAGAIPGRYLEHPRKACNLTSPANSLKHLGTPQQCQKMETTGRNPLESCNSLACGLPDPPDISISLGLLGRSRATPGTS